MSAIALEVLFILLLIIANGILAMSEIAVVSARKARLQQQANEGDAEAQAALALANAPGPFLATTQIGITLVGILAGAFGGATIAKSLAALFDRSPLIAPYGEAIGLGIVVIATSYLSLILGELVPKRLALNNPERTAAAIARPMHALSALASPIIRFLDASTEGVLRVLRIKPSAESPVTEEEIKVLVQQGAQAGAFLEAERSMVEGVFRLGDLRVDALMTPRPEVVWLDLDDPPEENRRKIGESGHARFPVGQGSLDNVLGVVRTKDLLVRSLAGQPFDLKASLRQPLFVPETVRALKVLEMFKESGRHIALVIDEHGGFQGLITIDDILEAIVGDIAAAGTPSEEEAIQRADGSWLVDGMLTVDKFKELFNVRRLPGEGKGYYQTLGGFVMMSLGRVPSPGDYLEWGGLRLEVVDMDGRRIDKVLVVPGQRVSSGAEGA